MTSSTFSLNNPVYLARSQYCDWGLWESENVATHAARPVFLVYTVRIRPNQ